MKISKWAQGAVGFTAAAAILAGCSSGGAGSSLAPTSGGQGMTSQAVQGHGNYFAGVGQMKQAHPIKTKSWMSNAAKNSKLVYYSDGIYGTLNAYSYPGGTPMGQLTGFSQPQGMCSVPTHPETGNFWVANTSASNVIEYAHGGTTPLATINISGQYPVGCSSDPTTGNLAVANIITTSGGAGSIYVYTSPSSTPTTYSVSGMSRVYFESYDKSGNLFVDGQNPSGVFTFAELPKGGSSFQTLSVSGLSVTFPGTVSWDNEKSGHLVVCDQLGSCFQLTESGSTLSVTATFSLSGASDVVQGTATRSRLIGPDAGLNQLHIYDYPSGNVKLNINGANSGGQPIGSALSLQHQ
jgi:hypothetical protein